MLTHRHPSQRVGYHRRLSRWLWLLPILFALILRCILLMGLLSLVQLVTIAVAVLLFPSIVRRPALALRLLVVVLPFQLLITSALYRLGVPGGLVRVIGLWKEMAAAAVVIAAWAAIARSRHSFDTLDSLALTYVSLGTAYLLLPAFLLGGGPGSSLSLDVRFIGWRTTVLPVLLLIAARHIRLTSRQLAGLVRTALAVGIALGAIALFEFAASGAWNDLMVNTLEVNQFRVEVLETSPSLIELDDIRAYGEVAGRQITRVGGPMLSYLQLSFALLVAGGLLLERLVRDTRSRLAALGTILVGIGVLVTQTRSAIVGGLLVSAVVLRPGAGRSTSSRIRYGSLAVAVLVIALPLVLGSGLSQRLTAGDSQSDVDHEESVSRGFDVVMDNPLGRGLATAAEAGSVQVQGAITAENQFLDIGLQLGWLGLVLFVAVLVTLIRTLHRSSLTARDPTVQSGLLGTRNSLIALLVPCWYLQPFATVEVAWVVFALAGAALGAVDDAKVGLRSHDRVVR